IADERGGGVVLLRLNASTGALFAHRPFHGATMERNPVVPGDGRIYLTGTIEDGTVNFGGGAVPAEDDPNPSQNGYLAMLEADGTPLLSHGWMGRRIMETFELHQIEGRRFVPDGAGGYWFLAYYQGEVSF